MCKCSLTYRQVIFLDTNIISAAAGVVVVHTVGLREHVYKINWACPFILANIATAVKSCMRTSMPPCPVTTSVHMLYLHVTGVQCSGV